MGIRNAGRRIAAGAMLSGMLLAGTALSRGSRAGPAGQQLARMSARQP